MFVCIGSLFFFIVDSIVWIPLCGYTMICVLTQLLMDVLLPIFYYYK